MPRKDSPKQKIIVVYVPVLHRGYIELFKRHPDAKCLYVIGEDLLKREDYIRKDLRALPQLVAVGAIEGLKLFNTVKVLTEANISELDGKDIIFADDDISHALVEEFDLEATYEPIFLRWDRRSVAGVDQIDKSLSISDFEFDRTIMKQALSQAQLSSDIWRRVGAVLLTPDNKLIGKSENYALPENFTPLIESDPRGIFNQGVGLEMTTFMHAEAGLIAKAAKNGTPLDGASIYVSTYPCPACAKLIAESGIKKCFVKDGYAILDGKRTLENANVEVIQVLIQDLPDRNGEWVPYPQKSN